MRARLFWFALLYLAGIASVGLVALLLRMILRVPLGRH